VNIIDMKSSIVLLLLILACLGLPAEAVGSSALGLLNNNLLQISWSIWSYHETYHSFPDDIRDGQGKPLLSWRVRLLPFLENDPLYKEFKLDEPWDGPHNRELIKSIPPLYVHVWFYDPSNPGRTHVLAPRAADTFFGVGEPRRAEDIRNPLVIMVMEVDRDHGTIWTKPDDFKYDPTHPGKALGRFRAVALADKTVRSVPESADPDLLRCLFSIQAKAPIRLDLPWYEALGEFPDGEMISGCFAISLVFILAGLAVVWRLRQGKPTSPGEMLFLILGMQQIVFVPAFMACYRFKLLPALWTGNEGQPLLWTLPSLAGAVGTLVALLRFHTAPVWRVLFGLTLITLCFIVLESMGLHQHFLARESLATIGHPRFMAMFAAAMGVLSLGSRGRDAWVGRRFWHWAGIVAGIVPLVWFFIWYTQGIVIPRDFLVRVRD
jgi:hypothetical protein